MSERVGTPQNVPGAHDVPNRAYRGWMAPAALIVALVATGISFWSAVESSDARTSAAEVLSADEAKSKACSAFDIVQRAVNLQTNADLGPELVAREVVAANARLATIGGGQYLLHNLNAGAPAELGDAMRSFANDLLEVGMGQLAGLSSHSPDQAGRLAYLEALRPQIVELCR